jgi:ribosome-binding protein aMBF1 (putative translation factor)
MAASTTTTKARKTASKATGRKAPAAKKSAPAKPAARAKANGAAKRTPATQLIKAEHAAAYVAQVVTGAREAAGLSKAQLAERMATSAGAVARIEDARTNCTAATLANVAQALGKKLVISFA